MTFAALGGIQDNLGSLTGAGRVAITSVNAYTAGDRMVISGNIQNIGSQPFTSVLIDEITAGDLVITQNPAVEDGQIHADHGKMTLSGLPNIGASTPPTSEISAITASAGTLATSVDGAISKVWTTNTTSNFHFGDTSNAVAVVEVTGLSTLPTNLEPLAAGASKSFRIVIHGDSSVNTGALAATVLDILKTVPASTELFITVAATDGQTTTISDPRSTRVTAR